MVKAERLSPACALQSACVERLVSLQLELAKRPALLPEVLFLLR